MKKVELSPAYLRKLARGLAKALKAENGADQVVLVFKRQSRCVLGEVYELESDPEQVLKKRERRKYRKFIRKLGNLPKSRVILISKKTFRGHSSREKRIR